MLSFLCVRSQKHKILSPVFAFIPNKFQGIYVEVGKEKGPEEKWNSSLIITHNNRITYISGNNHILHRVARKSGGWNMNIES